MWAAIHGLDSVSYCCLRNLAGEGVQGARERRTSKKTNDTKAVRVGGEKASEGKGKGRRGVEVSSKRDMSEVCSASIRTRKKKEDEEGIGHSVEERISAW